MSIKMKLDLDSKCAGKRRVVLEMVVQVAPERPRDRDHRAGATLHDGDPAPATEHPDDQDGSGKRQF